MYKYLVNLNISDDPIDNIKQMYANHPNIKLASGKVNLVNFLLTALSPFLTLRREWLVHCNKKGVLYNTIPSKILKRNSNIYDVNLSLKCADMPLILQDRKYYK